MDFFKIKNIYIYSTSSRIYILRRINGFKAESHGVADFYLF